MYARTLAPSHRRCRHRKTLQRLPPPELFVEHSLQNHSQLSMQLSAVAPKKQKSKRRVAICCFVLSFAGTVGVRGGTCDICSDMLEIILHVIVAQIGGQRH